MYTACHILYIWMWWVLVYINVMLDLIPNECKCRLCNFTCLFYCCLFCLRSRFFPSSFSSPPSPSTSVYFSVFSSFKLLLCHFALSIRLIFKTLLSLSLVLVLRFYRICVFRPAPCRCLKLSSLALSVSRRVCVSRHIHSSYCWGNK